MYLGSAVSPAILWLSLIVGGFLLSGILTAVITHYAAKRGLLDIPNNRSSHVVPTPRGGGLAIVVTVCLGVSILAYFGILPGNLWAAFVGGGLLIAGISLIDDCHPLRARWRILVHFIAAAWAVWWLGGFPHLTVGQQLLELGRLGSLLALIGIVWLANVYNFMDGIDGLAGGEGMVVGLAGSLLLASTGAAGLALVAGIVGVAAAGFLVWNWSPAKIFMGDVGSVFLGFTFAVLMLASEKVQAVPLLGWVLLLSVFILDGTVVTLRRAWRGERWFEAHRTFAYQQATQRGHSHAAVSASLLVMGLIWAVVITGVMQFIPQWLPVAVGAGLLVTAAGLWPYWQVSSRPQ